MITLQHHTFHIPVMGLGYTIDTPLKVARFGISSVVSIIEDNLIEQMREFYCGMENEEFIPIPEQDEDHRAKRITAYLNLLDKLVKKQIKKVRLESFEKGNDIYKYFELLPDDTVLKQEFVEMQHAYGQTKKNLQDKLRENISAGSIDVNIMTKLDKPNYSASGEKLPVEYCDAMSALRGYAESRLASSIVFSAGMNPRLYNYGRSFPDFLPDANGHLVKKIILKVSDYRSALIQGKFLTKKGLWISEFRIESGLNCGGHAFATDGLLLGPILEEFKLKKTELYEGLLEQCNQALIHTEKAPFANKPELKITVQGGIGTSNESKFLLEYYNLNSIGWGSPFLLVPEVTNVDNETLKRLAASKKEDYYLSHASPLGIPFNNFRKSTAEDQRKNRISKGRPGSPCYLKFLASDTEFTEKPICTASREYQNLKIKQLDKNNHSDIIYETEFQKITEKDCLCEGLGVSSLLKNNLTPPHNLNAVTICPGPNLAYFSGIYLLQEMTDHIYGRRNILNSLHRPHVFINELRLYVDFLKKEIKNNVNTLTNHRAEYFRTYKENLLNGITYYRSLIPRLKAEGTVFLEQMKNDLATAESEIAGIVCG